MGWIAIHGGEEGWAVPPSTPPPAVDDDAEPLPRPSPESSPRSMLPPSLEIETVDISLTRGIPTVLEVLDLLKANFKIGRIWQAEEFHQTNTPETIAKFAQSFGIIPLTREAHVDFKKRVPHAIGLIRTGDPTAYGNIILESE